LVTVSAFFCSRLSRSHSASRSAVVIAARLVARSALLSTTHSSTVGGVDRFPSALSEPSPDESMNAVEPHAVTNRQPKTKSRDMQVLQR
jgi:hypothetical protein